MAHSCAAACWGTHWALHPDEVRVWGRQGLRAVQAAETEAATRVSGPALAPMVVLCRHHHLWLNTVPRVLAALGRESCQP